MVVVLVLLVDQVSKFIVKTSMTLGQSFRVFGDWFLIHFTENYGMAFGMEFAGEHGKLILSLFRIVAVIVIAWYLGQLVNKKAPRGLIASVSLIMAGALGNIIDSAFYGMLFSESHFNQVAAFLPEGGGYATFLHGRVVDMFYFPLIRTELPGWLPLIGGNEFVFFRPVFNVADSAITSGVFILLVFQRRFFAHEHKSEQKVSEEISAPEPVSGPAEQAASNCGFLFEQIIFGPIRSRRLGISLGVNLLPVGKKVCTFNCVYCECGWTPEGEDKAEALPSKEDVLRYLEEKLSSMKQKKAMLTTITFAGNGEPSLHPDFSSIVDETIVLRNEYYPFAKIAVLSNASRAGIESVAGALMKVEQNILKLDAGTEESFRLINQPKTNITLQQVLQNLKQFKGKLIIQTLFVKGIVGGKAVDNTTEEEVAEWLKHIEWLKPELVMIYPIARATPTGGLEKIPAEKLQEIAERVETLGIRTEVY